LPFQAEALEARRLLSAGHHTHLRHHWHTGFHITPSAMPNYVFAGATAEPAASASPYGFSPATVRHAYGIDATSFNGITGDGSGQTIAIVDAYNDPNIAADLATFDRQFGLPDPVFTVMSQTGSTTSLPGVDPAPLGNTWAVEESLDVQWAHAVAPKANILLVESNTASLTDLIAAVDTARNVPGVSAVSMSWVTPEFWNETSYDAHFTTPAGHQGVTFIASSGDTGAYTSAGVFGVEHPATSPNVLAVGGAGLTVDANNNYVSETAWGNGTNSFASGGAGGGISQYYGQPSYQQGIVTQTSTQRAVPDVAFLADPMTGVATVDSYDFGTATPWFGVGGTSLAAPMWAGVLAMANQGRALNGLGSLDGPTGTLPALYQLPGSDFHDITTGNNGYPAGPGYDLVTGRGTPIVNLLAPALAGNAVSTPTIGSLTVNPTSVKLGKNVTFTASGVVETGGTIASVKFYQGTNGVPGLQIGSDRFLGSGTRTGTNTWALTMSSQGMGATTDTVYAVATDTAGVSSAPISAQFMVHR
jgi:subtilase family serine protease